MILLEKMVFTDVIKLRISRSEYPSLGCSLRSMSSFLVEKRMGESHVKTETETGGMLPRAKNTRPHEGLEEATRKCGPANTVVSDL